MTPMDACSIAAAVRTGRMSAESFVVAALTVIANSDGDIGACAALYREASLEAAREIDAQVAAGASVGPLAGVPFLVKHNLDVAGCVTVAGSPARRNHPAARHDARAVARLRAAGAIPVGATHMDELACGATGENPHFGAVRLPQDRERMTGGSSSGSAAAVAAGFVPVALGTDTNGSVRAPAALCGVWGWRPTHGGVSTSGCVPYAHTLDTVGAFARNIDDLTVLWQVMSEDATQASGAERRDTVFRVGVLVGDFHENSDAQQHAALARAAACYNEAKPVVLPVEEIAAVRAAAVIVSNYEVARAHGALLQASPEMISPRLRQRLEIGLGISDGEYAAALACRERWRERMNALFADFDALLAPATPYSAPRFDTPVLGMNGRQWVVAQTLGMLTQPISFAGLPVVSAPVPSPDPSALPCGVQVIGAHGADAVAFGAARQLSERLWGGDATARPSHTPVSAT